MRNYIRELNAFYEWVREHGLSSNAIALWNALMNVNNRTRWTEEFSVASSELELLSGLSNTSFKRARKELTDAGLIVWKSRGGNQSAVYQIRKLAGHSGLQAENAVGHSGPQIETVGHSGLQTGVTVGHSGPISKQDLKTLKPKQKNRGEMRDLDNTNGYASFYALFPKA